jgi:hypothetical protein
LIHHSQELSLPIRLAKSHLGQRQDEERSPHEIPFGVALTHPLNSTLFRRRFRPKLKLMRGEGLDSVFR